MPIEGTDMVGKFIYFSNAGSDFPSMLNDDDLHYRSLIEKPLWPNVTEENMMEEQRNINMNWPLFPGATISKEGANACVDRGWAYRDDAGFYYPTDIAPGVRRATPPKHHILPMM